MNDNRDYEETKDIRPDPPYSGNRNSSALHPHIEKDLVDSINHNNDKSSNEMCQENDESSNEKFTFEHPLVVPPSKIDIKPSLMK